MKPLLLLSLFFFGLLDIQAQSALSWGHRFGNTEDTRMYGVAVDASENVYTIGSFIGTVDFDPGPGTANLTSAGDLDVFISKLDADGHFVWAKQLGGADEDFGNAIALDPLGNVYTVGYFYGTADFDPNAGTTNLLALGEADAFICKLDSNGILMWAAKAGGIDYDEANSVAVDSNGDVLFGGFFNDLANFNPGPGVNTLTSAGGQDAFITKLNAGGIFVWAERFGGIGDDAIRDLALDVDDHVITTGRFFGTVDFDPGAGTSSLSSSGMNDAFVSMLDVSGNFVRAGKFGASENDEGLGVHVDEEGNVITTGYFHATVDFDPGPNTANLTSAGQEDVFISKLTGNGDYVWARRFGNVDVEKSHDVTTDQSGNVYTTGYFSGTVDFDPDAGNVSLTSTGLFDTFISKLTAAGEFVWASQMGGDQEVKALTMALDTAGNMYCAGSFDGTGDFDPGGNQFNLSASGIEDAFLVRLHQCVPTFSELSVSSCESFLSPGGTHTWTDSGTYADTLINVSGCDSIITVNLTIFHQSESEMTVSACESYMTPGGDPLTASGIYTDTIPNAVGCDSIIVINLTINSVDTSVVYEENYSLTAQMDGATYQWIDCGDGNQLIPEAIDQIFYPVASGSYAVIISANDCSDTSSCHNAIIAGTKENNSSGLHLYPNPANDYVLVEMSDVFKDGLLSIFDIRGDEIYRFSFHGEKEMRLNLNLTAGIYFVSMKDAGRYTITKLIVE